MKPNKKRVRAYWREREESKYFAKGWDDTEKTCFACGNDGHTITAAHVHPNRDREDNDRDSNIHLLCELCHKESEPLRDKAYWHWLHLTALMYDKGKLGFGMGLGADPYYSNSTEGGYTPIVKSINLLREAARTASPGHNLHYTYCLTCDGKPVGPEIGDDLRWEGLGDEEE
tara:strand:+ start:61 stop:576 length:516 start_codon:yes stop_codon:yes gene_type:complete